MAKAQVVAPLVISIKITGWSSQLSGRRLLNGEILEVDPETAAAFVSTGQAEYVQLKPA